jgi:hypothetical protein
MRRQCRERLVHETQHLAAVALEQEARTQQIHGRQALHRQAFTEGIGEQIGGAGVGF